MNKDTLPAEHLAPPSERSTEEVLAVLTKFNDGFAAPTKEEPAAVETPDVDDDTAFGDALFEAFCGE